MRRSAVRRWRAAARSEAYCLLSARSSREKCPSSSSSVVDVERERRVSGARWSRVVKRCDHLRSSRSCEKRPKPRCDSSAGMRRRKERSKVVPCRMFFPRQHTARRRRSEQRIHFLGTATSFGFPSFPPSFKRASGRSESSIVSRFVQALTAFARSPSASLRFHDASATTEASVPRSLSSSALFQGSRGGERTGIARELAGPLDKGRVGEFAGRDGPEGDGRDDGRVGEGGLGRDDAARSEVGVLGFNSSSPRKAAQAGCRQGGWRQ